MSTKRPTLSLPLTPVVDLGAGVLLYTYQRNARKSYHQIRLKLSNCIEFVVGGVSRNIIIVKA